MSVERYCRRDPVTVRPNASVREAALAMQARGVGMVVVVDDEGRPVGALSDRDVALRAIRSRLDAAAVPVSDLMRTPAVTIRTASPLAVAIRVLRREGIRRLPVVDGRTGRVVGVLAADDVLELASAELEAVAEVIRKQAPDGGREGSDA